MKKVVGMLKKAAKWYFKTAAENYTWMWTGCTYRGTSESEN